MIYVPENPGETRSARIGFKNHRRIKGLANDNNILNENVLIAYEVTVDDILQLSNSVQLNGADYVPATKEAQTFSTDVVEIVSYDADETWPCKSCGQIFPTKLALTTHKNTEHTQAEIDEQFKTLAKCIGVPELYVCNVCNVAYQEEAEIEQHMKIHEKESQYFPCNQCNEIFFSKYSLGSHRNIKHAKVVFEKPTFKFDEVQELYICNTCSAEYQNKAEVEKHLKTHERNFSCIVCDEKFQRPYDLGTHSIIHYNDKMYRCPLCTYKTPTRRNLLVHINCIHLKNVPYVCKVCNKGFVDRVLYKEHDNIHKGIKPFKCVVCTKGFAYSSCLLQHQVRMHRVDVEGQLWTNQCTMCKEVFTLPISLEKHIQRRHARKHPRQMQLLCDICGKGFPRQHDLNIHYTTHTGVKAFTCTHCGKKFARRNYLVIHERVHSGEKPFACEYCEKCFSQKPALNVHQRKHTGERPYVCQFCNKGFTSKAALNIHFKSCEGL